MQNTFFMWGEEGLLASLLIDIAVAPVAAARRFFKEIEFCGDNKDIRTFKPAKMWCVTDPVIGGEKGFGRPGAVVVFENTSKKKVVLFIELSRSRFANGSKPVSLRGTRGYASSLNGRAEQNYCLGLALSGMRKKDKILREPDWILKTPYNLERHHVLRFTDDPDIIKNLIRPVAGQKKNLYLHLIITPDDMNPYKDGINLPEIFNEKGEDVWDEKKGQFGWISFSACEALVRSARRKQFISSLAANSASIEPAPGGPEFERGRPLQGVSLVYAPTVWSTGLCHFSWRGKSGILRRYDDPKSRPIVAAKASVTEIMGRITAEIVLEQKKPVGDSKFWYNTIMKHMKYRMPSFISKISSLASLTYEACMSLRFDHTLPKENVDILIKAGVQVTAKLLEKHALRKIKKKDMPCFVPEQLEYPVGASVFEVFGNYNPATSEIVIYDRVCSLGAEILGVDPDILVRTVFDHMAAHAITHRGREREGKIWKGFVDASSKDRETFAQVYPSIYYKLASDSEAGAVFREITKLQSPSYNLWSDYLYMQMQATNDAFIKARRSKPSKLEMLVFSYDGSNPWCRVRIITDDGRIFRSEVEGFEWKNLRVTDYHVEPYTIARERLKELKDYILSNDMIYIPGGMLRDKIITQGVRGSTTIRINIDNIENEWIGAGRDWGEYGHLFRYLLNLFDKAVAEAGV